MASSVRMSAPKNTAGVWEELDICSIALKDNFGTAKKSLATLTVWSMVECAVNNYRNKHWT